ncbi:GNAT family N-acetyltransferase [Sinorhizobium sp. RAC02]|uniref:GNAT family N-acetyltransferase n=1 Tax=Sinorhizobium sp. RAC02 TaxID=1842534 RepID=UPI00083D1846|nr:GNAT family N-acetyltransferase [Sinorhizobium sp. RAC02]AOF93855.1 GCN5-related N-acetyl-transferase family protein [Sinorhizobium sp. RAC02]
MNQPENNAVVERPDQHRFELAVDGGTATVYYRLEDGRLVLTHTEVPQELSGRGVGSRLVTGVFDLVRASHRKVVIRCPFVAAWYARHLDYGDIVDG